MSKHGARTEIVLDTSVAIAILNDKGHVGTWVRAFDGIYLPVIVLGELRFGALKSSKPKVNLERIQTLVDRCNTLDVQPGTAATYARIRCELRFKGKPMPENDLWIAAICLENSLPVATYDKHFLEVEDLEVQVTPG